MAKRILFLANHFITLYSFRKEMIGRMVSEGHEVYLSLPESEENEYFEKMGCKIIPTEIDRRGVNPIKDMKLLRFYRRMIPGIAPDIIFSYTIKPNIYGTFASNSCGVKQVCNITGTGATFLKPNLISSICQILYRVSVRKCYKVFFQNRGDKEFFLKHKMVRESNCAMLPGSGCNLVQHRFLPMPEGDDVNFIYIGRVMKLKGIDEYLECAKRIHSKYPSAHFLIAGWNEEEEYMEKVNAAQNEGYVEYIGFRKDIDQWIAKCHCTILASHGGEGVPNVLLESAATGRACIASEINGSKDAVDDGVTGYLFKTGNSDDLISKVELFLGLSKEQRSAMGYAGRQKIEREFDREIVIGTYMDEVAKA